ncbi:MAG: hypothetical protein JWM59_2637 [Verrucomicrobiales bacterium]|nr:hypothetical protein [Verrucomicrobiales bacterium]
MKLHLHWLRFDLRRFRLILGVWTLLVTSYAVFLGWVHLRFLTISQDVMDRSLYIPILLGLVELGFLFALFNADPAKGPRHFWKTRPPSGVAVAGSKLVLALTFFVALPVLAWWAVNAFCVLQEYAVVQSSTGLSWTAFLFWIQSLTVSAFTLAAARPESKRDFYLHLAASIATVAAGVWALREIWDTLASKSMDPALERWLRNGFFSPLMAVLSLAAAIGYLLLVRRRRLPPGRGLAWVLLMPAGILLTASAAWRAPAVSPRDEALPPADPAMAGKIRITERFPSVGSFDDMGPYDGGTWDPYHIAWPSSERIWFYATLKVEGLPSGAKVSARWLNLRLTAPDGTVLQADTQSYPPPPYGTMPQNPAALRTYGTPFASGKLRPYDLTRCTASGTLRLTLYSWQEGILPYPDDRINASPLGPVLIDAQRGEWENQSTGKKLIQLSNVNFFDTGYPHLWRMSLTWDTGELPLEVYVSNDVFSGGFLVRHGRIEGSAWIQHSTAAVSMAGPPLPDGCHFKIGACNPVGTLDVSVTLPGVIPWTGQSTAADLVRMLAGIHPDEKASVDEARSDLRYALNLIYHIERGRNRQATAEEQLLKSVVLWRDILGQVSHTNLPALIDLIRDNAVYDTLAENRNRGFKNPPFILQIHDHLRKRAAELLQPADMPGILADPDLTAKLLPFLPASAVPETIAPQGSPTGSEDQKPDR